MLGTCIDVMLSTSIDDMLSNSFYFNWWYAERLNRWKYGNIVFTSAGGLNWQKVDDISTPKVKILFSFVTTLCFYYLYWQF